MSSPLPSAETFPRLPPGDDDHVGDFPVELLDDLDAHGLLPLDPERVHGIGQIDRLVLGDLPHHAHAAVEIRVQRQDQRAIGDRLYELGHGYLALGQKHDGLDAGSGAVDRERGRGIAGRGAGHGLDRRALADHLLDLRHQHGHAEVLERSAVGVAAELEPEVVHADELAEPLGPEEVGSAFVERDDVVVGDLRQDPFLFAPDARAIGPLGGLVTVLEELHPRLGAAVGEGLHVVLYFQQRIAGLAAINDLVERILLIALFIDTLKPGSIWHRF